MTGAPLLDTTSVPSPPYLDAPHVRYFWEKGMGKDLTTWTGASLSEKDFPRFYPLYYSFDGLSDTAVQDTYLSLPYPEASALIQGFLKGEKPLENTKVPQSLPLLVASMQRPEWFDSTLASHGASLCMRAGTNALMILRDFTLMGGYDFAYLNKPLIYTGALKKGAVKRLKDTLEFWVAVTRENALEPGSEAMQLILRTRMMHSYARLKIKAHAKDWDFVRWGEPINTWDMVATYTGFSLIFMLGLKKMGMHITAKEEKGLFHLWKYVGYLLGIPQEVLPSSARQATEWFYLWTLMQAPGDAHSKELAQALLEENLQSTIYPFLWQRKAMRTLHQSMSSYLLDPPTLERLGIATEGSHHLFPKFVTKINYGLKRLYPVGEPKRYEAMKKKGHQQQLKVLSDYIKHTPKDFRY